MEETLSSLDGTENLKTHERRYLLDEAAKGGYKKALKILLQHDPGEKIKVQALRKAVENGHIDSTKILLKHGADPNDDIFEDCLNSCIEDHRNGMVKILLNPRYGLDPNLEVHGLPLPVAIMNNNIYAISRLLERDIHRETDRALKALYYIWKEEVVSKERVRMIHSLLSSYGIYVSK